MSLVEYHDPDGLFPLISRQLRDHLPIKHLHWTSSTGLVRSIDSLHLDLTPAPKHVRANAASVDQASGLESAIGANRRHQLPGLRQTPSLRLFLFRCDDKEAYKSFKRDTVRSWLESATAPSKRNSKSSIKQENHDASEWLVVHIVLPNTLAANEPRWTRDSASDTDLPKEKSAGGARWPGKRSRSILERLRADFNSTNKSAPDRVAQIRLRKDEIPLDIGPELPPATSSAHPESLKERENSWTDLVAKAKALILRSFDLRVNQYESDLHAKELQRALPGWNFCTFFVIKEGLIKTFESIGLIEDALHAYEELLVELDSLLEEHVDGRASDQSATAFASCSSEFAAIVDVLLRENDAEAVASAAKSAFQTPLDPMRKDYLESVVANAISVFDLKCYVHSRKIALMVRLGKPHPQHFLSLTPDYEHAPANSQTEKQEKACEYDNLAVLADVCKVGAESIPVLARLLRVDVSRCRPMTDDVNFTLVVEVLIASWTYAATRQLFVLTESKHFDHVKQANFAEDHFLSSAGKHGSHLVGRASDSTRVLPTSTLEAQKSSTFLKSFALLQAAASRADYCLSQRRILGKVLQWKNWRLADNTKLDEEAENYDALQDEVVSVSEVQPAYRIFDKLRDTLLSDDTSTLSSLKNEYEQLSNNAAGLYLIAGREYASRQLLRDIAALKFHEGDFAVAATSLAPIISSLNRLRWNLLENDLLSMYATSLKVLNRKNDFVQAALSILAKQADSEPSNAQRSLGRKPTSRAERAWVNEDIPPAFETLDNVLTYSEQLPYDLHMPLTQFFHIAEIDHHITLFDEQDGFSLDITVQPRLHEGISHANISLCLYGSGVSEGSELWLNSSTTTPLITPSTQVALACNVTSFGSYKIGKIMIQAGRIIFVHEIMRKPQPHNPLVLPQSENDMSCELGKRAPIKCYPRQGALKADLETAKFVHMGQKRSLELSVYAGKNTIHTAQIFLKSGTAGLRIHTGRAEAKRSSSKLLVTGSPGALEVTQLAPMEHIRILIPTDIENDCSRLFIGIEIVYTTPAGKFSYVKQAQVSMQLSLDVNVQDFFRSDHIISKFYLSPTNAGPSHVCGVDLEGNADWRTEGGLAEQEASDMPITSEDSACVSYRVFTHDDTVERSERQSRMLKLRIKYRPMVNGMMSSAMALLSNACEESSFAALGELILNAFESTLQDYFSDSRLEEAALFSEVDMPTFSAVDWAPALEAISDQKRASVEQWLQEWHESIDMLQLQDEPDQVQVLEIDFEVPTLDYLHLATVSMDDAANISSANSIDPLTVIGTPLHCQATVNTTCRWASDKPAVQDKVVHFMYRLDYDPAAWLVSGPERAVFAAKSGDSITINVIFIALVGGQAMLPTVDVQPISRSIRERHPAGSTSPGDGPGPEAAVLSPVSFGMEVPSFPEGLLMPVPSSNEARVSCETLCTTDGKAVLVVETLEGHPGYQEA